MHISSHPAWEHLGAWSTEAIIHNVTDADMAIVGFTRVMEVDYVTRHCMLELTHLNAPTIKVKWHWELTGDEWVKWADWP